MSLYTMRLGMGIVGESAEGRYIIWGWHGQIIGEPTPVMSP
ncbi:MAG: hypothetical protein ACTHMT_13755 [Verrucomicrobiota bacterium]